MRAAVYKGPGNLVLEEIETPIPKRGEVLIEVGACSVCGTDRKIFRYGHPKIATGTELVLGHEIAGTIVEVGEGVTFYQRGMRVAVAPNVGCGHCSMCRRAHGAGYVTWVGVRTAQLRVVAGADCLVRYPSSDHGVRQFCGRCGSSLFCESTHHPERVDVTLTNLQGEIDRPPELHVYFDDRAPWVRIGDDLPRLGGTTGLEPL